MTTPHIVVVGGGAGGLELVTKLGNKFGKRSKAKITLIDAKRTHIWKPRLHEVASGALNATVDELSYVGHAHRHGFEFVLGRMQKLSRAEKIITLDALVDDDGQQILAERVISYDYLVIAVGSQTNHFNTPGAKENCIFLDNRRSAEQFHRTFINMYLRASSDDEATHNTKFNIAIVGAGATGVELAAELNHSAHQLEHYGFKGIKPENVSITIIEASERVLPVLSEKASKAIKQQLESLDIKVLTQEMVTDINEQGLQTKSGKFIEAQLKVWSAGVKAPEWLKDLDGLQSNRINQLVVLPTLRTTQDESIYAFGDCAQCPIQNSDRFVPPRAQSAHQQAMTLYKTFKQKLKGRDDVAYVYKDKGSLISLGKSGSVGNMMGNLSGDFTFQGKVARLFYIALYRMHQIAVHGMLSTGLLMVRDYLNRRTGPRLKLH